MNGLLIFDQMRTKGATPANRKVSARRLSFAIRNEQIAVRNAQIRANAVKRELPNELSGILDDIKAVVAPYISKASDKLKKEFANQISSAQTKLESKLGDFLSTGQKIVDLKARAQAQQNSPKPEVKSRAIAITAKANGLQAQYESIKTAAVQAAQNLVMLKNQIATNPALQFDNPMSAGTRIVELFNQFRGQIASSVSSSASVAARIATHLKDVAGLQDDVQSLENYAEGKGWSATFDRATSFYGDTMSTVVKIAAVGGLIYLLAPSLLGRMARAKS